jgi:hypothetical protein
MLVIPEKIANWGKPGRDSQTTLRTALQFLSNPYILWGSKQLEDKRAVLKLAFSERLAYVRNEGCRTAKTSLPFNMGGGVSDGDKVLVGPEGLER